MLPASALLSQKAVPVHAHSESEIRKSFLNCSKGAAHSQRTLTDGQGLVERVAQSLGR